MEAAEGHIPMKTVSYMIAAVLADQAAHGYGIMKEVARRSGGRVAPGPATVHRTLKRLVQDGLVEETTARLDPVLDDPRRKYFSLTPLGRAVVRAETEGRFQFVSNVRDGLGEEGA